VEGSLQLGLSWSNHPFAILSMQVTWYHHSDGAVRHAGDEGPRDPLEITPVVVLSANRDIPNV
jgi:hypothetical protein